MKSFHYENIFAVQSRLVGANYNKIDRTKEGWVMKHSWDSDTENQFVQWLADYIHKRPGVQREVYGRTGMSKRDCLRAADGYNLNYGWRAKI